MSPPLVGSDTHGTVVAGGVLPEREEEYNPFLEAVAAALLAAEPENPFAGEAGVGESGAADEELAAELEADLEDEEAEVAGELEPVEAGAEGRKPA